MKFAIKDWNSDKTKSESENMWKNAKTSRKISLASIILGHGTVNAQLFLRICQELKILPSKAPLRSPYVDSYFPYNIKPSPVYEITCLLQYTGITLATVAYSGIYSYYVSLTLHLCSQLTNLRNRIEGMACSQEDRKKFRIRLAEVVERHESLNR